jgi:hypothetical protein
MPASFTCYVNKASEVIVDSSSELPITLNGKGITLVSAPILGSKHDSDVIGTMMISKLYTEDNIGNKLATFTYTLKFNADSDLPSSPFSDVLCLTEKLYNNFTIPENGNPSENIPAGESSVVLTGAVNQFESSGEFCNQFGYFNKTKDLTQFRTYEVNFPQLVASYTNVFNSLPQPSVAPLA